MEQGNDPQQQPEVKTEGQAEPSDPVEKQSGGSLFGWGSVLVGGLTAISGIVGSPLGIGAALGIVIAAIIAVFAGKRALNKWRFTKAKEQAAAKAGSEASEGQEKLNNNRDQIDDFLGRDRRS